MKTLLSLILPENSVFRYLKKGRKGIGFIEGQLVTRSAAGTIVGVSTPTAAETATNSSATVALNQRVNYLTHTSATVEAALPPVAGDLREVIVIKNGANGVNVNINSADTGSICLSASAAAATKFVVATATAGRFLSDGTYWYRVSA